MPHRHVRLILGLRTEVRRSALKLPENVSYFIDSGYLLLRINFSPSFIECVKIVCAYRHPREGGDPLRNHTQCAVRLSSWIPAFAGMTFISCY